MPPPTDLSQRTARLASGLKRTIDWRCATLGLAITAAVSDPSASHAAVSVVANRTSAPLRVIASAADRPDKRVVLQPWDARPFFHHGELRVQGFQGAASIDRRVAASAAYVFAKRPADDELVLNRLPLNDDKLGDSRLVGAATAASGPGLTPASGVVTVKILVDDDEARRRPVWEADLRRRIAEASRIMTAHSGIRFQVVATETWDSDDAQTDFGRSLAEFERKVRPEPAQLAIGFSSQFRIERGRYHLGGTRASLHSHILLKERAQNVLDPERLELLAHELGHFLGATHSSESTSAMRPVLGQGLQRRAQARVQFDAANTLLLAMMGEEIRFRGVRKLTDLTPATRRRMGQVYAAMQSRLPNDPAAAHYRQLIAAAAVNPLLDDARKIRDAYVRAAQSQQSGGSATDGDALLEFCVRQAAESARSTGRPHAAQAFLLAMGVVIDDSNTLARLPVAGRVVNRIENPIARKQRLSVLGKPTMRGRSDHAKHFFISAHVTALAGAGAAGGAGIAKEMLDAHGGSGFSFADMAANRAGVVFANALLRGGLSLDDIAADFSTEDFLPPVDGLRESMGAAEFFQRFGGGSRLDDELKRIESSIRSLPVYQKPSRP